MPVSTCNVCIKKGSVDANLGLTFFENLWFDTVVRVRLVHPGGLAATSGLQPDDVVLSINSKSCESPLNTERMLHESTGELLLTVERSLTCDVGDNDEAEARMMMPGGRHEAEATDEDGAEQSSSGDEDDDEDDEDNEDDEDDEEESEEEESEEEESEEEDGKCDGASAGEWTEWLSWMISRIQERKAELAELEKTVADELMVDALNADLIEEQRELARSIKPLVKLLVERRDELELYLEFCDDLSEEDTNRIEDIWKELADDEDTAEGDEDEVFPGSSFCLRRLSPQLAARRSDEGKESEELSETSEEASESVSEEEDETVAVGKSELVHERSTSVSKAEEDVHSQAQARTSPTSVLEEDVKIEYISLVAPTPAEDAVGDNKATSEKAEPRSFIQKQRSLSFSRRKKATAPTAADGTAGVNVSAAKAIFEAPGEKAEPRSFIQQPPTSFPRRKKATAPTAADGAPLVTEVNVSAAKAIFEAPGEKAEPRSFIQKQRSLSFSRRKKATAPTAADGAQPLLAGVDSCAATAWFGEHNGSLTRRVSDSKGTDKSTLMRQRLERARSSSGKLCAVTAPTLDEVGVQVYPL